MIEAERGKGKKPIGVSDVRMMYDEVDDGFGVEGNHKRLPF